MKYLGGIKNNYVANLGLKVAKMSKNAIKNHKYNNEIIIDTFIK